MLNNTESFLRPFSHRSRFLRTILYLFFLALLVANIAFPQEIIHVIKTNLFQWTFKEPVEKLLIFCSDGELLILTNQYVEGVVAKPWSIKEYLEKNNKALKDILFITHNHILPTKFSDGDYRFYRWLKNNGFEGEFIIYYHYDGKIKRIEK